MKNEMIVIDEKVALAYFTSKKFFSTRKGIFYSVISDKDGLSYVDEVNPKLTGTSIDLKGDSAHIKGDISNITGNLGHITNVTGDVTNISGDVTYIYGDVSGLTGCVTGLKGNATGLVGVASDLLEAIDGTEEGPEDSVIIDRRVKGKIVKRLTNVKFLDRRNRSR